VRVLLDECVPRRLAQAFGAEHAAATAAGLGWAGTKNGDLLRLAADRGFEAFVTVDVGLDVSPETTHAERAPTAGQAAAWPHREEVRAYAAAGDAHPAHLCQRLARLFAA
jgi:hypothetical protein